MRIIICLECMRKSTSNFRFEKTCIEPSITGAMQMYFTDMLVRYIDNHYEMIDIEMSNLQVL